jgi:hypothetical protein
MMSARAAANRRPIFSDSALHSLFSASMPLKPEKARKRMICRCHLNVWHDINGRVLLKENKNAMRQLERVQIISDK